MLGTFPVPLPGATSSINLLLALPSDYKEQSCLMELVGSYLNPSPSSTISAGHYLLCASKGGNSNLFACLSLGHTTAQTALILGHLTASPPNCCDLRQALASLAMTTVSFRACIDMAPRGLW